jgi:hypothetical protein
MPTSRVRETQEEQEERGVLAHVDHVRSVGEALTKAVDSFLTDHAASKKTGDWRDDLAKNLSKASIDAHTFLSESSKKVLDILSGDQDLEDSKTVRPTGGEATKPRKTAE